MNIQINQQENELLQLDLNVNLPNRERKGSQNSSTVVAETDSVGHEEPVSGRVSNSNDQHLHIKETNLERDSETRSPPEFDVRNYSPEAH